MKTIVVKKIVQAPDDSILPANNWREAGVFVSIRPCSEEYNNKTYLGLYLGEIALGLGTTYDEKKKDLSLHHSFYNTAIFVFELK